MALTLAGLMLGGTYVGVDDLINGLPQAEALEYGPGIHEPSVGGFAGGYTHGNGTTLYCLELGKLPDMGNSSPALNQMGTIPAYQASWIQQGSQVFNNVGAGALSADSSQYKRLAFLMGKYGQTNNNQQAAALALAIWEIRGEVGKTGDYDALLNAERQMAGSGAASQATQMVAEAAQWLAAGGNNTGGATAQPEAPVFTGTAAYKGELKVKKGTTKLTLTNAVFTQNGKSTMTWGENGLEADATFAWEGTPPADAEWNRYYRVTASGEYVYFTPGSSVIYATQGNLTDQSTGYATPGEPKRNTGKFKEIYVDPDALWAPTLTTEVPSEFVKKGEAFGDSVTFSAAKGDAFSAWRWYLDSKGDKKYAPIKAKGTLYGPMLSDPALNPAADAPAGTPVAGTAEVTTDLSKGPGTYQIKTDLKAKESGYYTWKWDIDWKDQSKAVTNPPGEHPSIPKDYFFTDGYGQAKEGQTVPTSLELSTQLSAPKVVIGDSFTDEVEISLVDGGWLRGADGKRLPYELVGTIYLQDGKPVQQATAPAEATEMAKVKMTADDTGKFKSETIDVPLTTKQDHLTVQWCVKGAEQPGASKHKVEDFCDDYGVPSETAKILRPEVTTQAQESGTTYGKIKDTAKVDGAMPKLPASVGFTAYLKPEAGQPKYDTDWNPVLDEDGEPVLWTEAEVSNPEAVCEAQPVAKTKRVKVDGVGEYDSPTVRAKSEGTVYWVEDLEVEDPKTKKPVELHRGKCGLPNETTVVEKPKVTTQAQEIGAVKGDIKDTALVEAPVTELPLEIDFTLYLKPEAGQPKYDENWKPVLDKEGNPVLWQEDEVDDPAAVCEAQPVAKTDRVEASGPGEYDSPTVRAETEGTAYWVEELFVEDPKTKEKVSLHRGECGLPNETTVIEKPKVKTKATPEANVGDKIEDTAIVTGPLSEREEISYEVTFEAYHRGEGTTAKVDEKLCTAGTKVWESNKATPVTTEGEYKSEKWKLKEDHIGEILWVETLTEIEKTDKGEKRTEIHRGACGEVDEITKVSPKEQLAFTGAVGTPLIVGAGAVLLLGGAAIAFAARRKSTPLVDTDN
ncbi:hypothetical protein JSO19_03930 [Leucobacter sp. UCMA 4100]|uniref:hypothetical protein n=1 Tax=Leucobacter sp. UCMA 4100 TaxID=2810534 RepID=UPI0022EA8490|nr:hypothetical protein [Leucobacter sp. UCMA 4100]MDA3146525.1 hypothetical protein [Leucobacter sp. UCMA 4100]